MSKKVLKKSSKENRNLIIFTAAITLVFAIAGFFNVFNKLDLRFYDFLLRFKKEIPQSEKVLMVEVDDQSLTKLGEWPWSRNILGDALIRLKELGAESASFDIEYINPSQMGVNSNVRSDINESISGNCDNVVSLISELSGAVSEGFIEKENINEFSNELINDYIYPSYNELQEDIIKNIYFDYDEYFARAIQFFGNVYLTINMRDLQINETLSQEYLDYVQNRILRDYVSDKRGLIKKGNLYEASRLDGDKAGFSPAMEKFMSRTKSASFTNSVVDDDGIRRRMEVLAEHNGKYVPQLAIGPLLDNLQVERIERKSRSIILYGAKFPDLDEKIDLKIPLDPKGYILINWRHNNIDESLKNISVLELHNLDDAENEIYLTLKDLSECYFEYEGQEMALSAFANELVQMYEEILSEKEYLLSRCTGFDENNIPLDGITDEMYENYFSMKKDFFENVNSYLNSGVEKDLDEVISYLIENELVDVETFSDFNETVSDFFAHLKEEIDFHNSVYESAVSKVQGSYCIIGNTASSTTDIGAVPFIKQYANVGIHGNVMNTVMNRKFFYSYEWFWAFFMAVILSAIPFLFSSEEKTPRNVAGAFTLVIGTVILLSLFIVFSIYIPMLTSILYMIVVYVFGVIYRFISSDKEKKFITNAFSQCLSKDVVDDIIKDPESLKLGGDMREMSAIFTDIQKFSSFSELLNAAELVALLNYYLTKMSDIIMDERGTVDKYEGDAIIALVGAPLTLEDHSFRACSAAIKMKKAEKEMNEEIVQISKEEMPAGMDPNLYYAFKIMVENEKTLFTRVGINSGEMVAGFMGSENKKNYTMMGNNVNLASRLEGVNKVYASSILCSEQCYDWANEGGNKGKIVFRRLDRVRVINIKKPVQLYNVIGFSDEISPEQKKEIDMFHSALELYLDRNFLDAGKLFLQADKVYHDDTALIFADRCKNYMEKGVPDNWDGVMTMTSK